jgi:hypothetical protein
VRELMSLAKSAMVVAGRGDEMETAEGVDGAAAAGVVGATKRVVGGGGSWRWRRDCIRRRARRPRAAA